MSSELAAPPTADVDRTDCPQLDWDALYRTHASTVTRWVSRLAGPTADVDDLVHEVFMAAAAGRFRGEAQLTTWLYRITARTVGRWRRRHRWWHRRTGPLTDDDAPLPTPNSDPEGQVAHRQQVRLLYRILDQLSDRDREILILHQLEELTGPEIADLYGLTNNAVWVRIHRARKRFERALQRHHQEETKHAR